MKTVNVSALSLLILCNKCLLPKCYRRVNVNLKVETGNKIIGTQERSAGVRHCMGRPIGVLAGEGKGEKIRVLLKGIPCMT